MGSGPIGISFVTAADGESPQDVASRADRFIAKVRQTTGDVIAFSSGHISRMVAAPPGWPCPPDAAGKLLCRDGQHRHSDLRTHAATAGHRTVER